MYRGLRESCLCVLLSFDALQLQPGHIYVVAPMAMASAHVQLLAGVRFGTFTCGGLLVRCNHVVDKDTLKLELGLIITLKLDLG